jgi:hypothetical protein
LIKHAEHDESTEVREEAAIQLRGTYVEDTSQDVLDWFLNEVHEGTRMALLEHMAAFAFRDEAYERMIVAAYQDAPIKSDIRVRLEAAAARTVTFRKLRSIELEEEGRNLFSNDNERSYLSVTNNITQNFNAPVGAATGSGNISASTINAINGMDSEQLKAVLLSVVSLIPHVASPDLQREGTQIVEEVAAAPTKSAVGRLIDWLGKAKGGVDATNQLVNSADGLIGTLQNFDLPG